MSFAGLHAECGGRVDFVHSLVSSVHAATSLRCARCGADSSGDLAPPRVVSVARTADDVADFLAALGFVADGHTRMEPVGGWRSGVMGGMARRVVGGRARYVLPVGARLRATVGARTTYLYTRGGSRVEEIAHLDTRGLEAQALGELVERFSGTRPPLKPEQYWPRAPTTLYPAWTVVRPVPGKPRLVDCVASGLTERQALAVAEALEALAD